VKVKLDENLGTAGAEVLTAAGFDVATAAEQELIAAPDVDIVQVCATEHRCLVHKYGDASRAPRRHARKAREARIPGVVDRRAMQRAWMRRRPNVTVFVKSALRHLIPERSGGRPALPPSQS
jgi:hypothetical protein